MTRATALCTTVALLAAGTVSAQAQGLSDRAERNWQAIENFCMDCHNFEEWAGGVAFDTMDPAEIPHDAEIWEETIRKLRGGLMPPAGEPRPENAHALEIAAWLEETIDQAASEGVTIAHVGHVPMRRLNRREYEYAIRDLLDLEVDATALLPADDIRGGYDNIAAALQVSPTFIDQYLNAARTVAHNAIGDRRPIPIMETYGNVADMIISLPPRGTDGTGTQQRHNPAMPFGTRGGVSVLHTFMADGEYELTIGDLALAREVPNMEFEHTLIALLNGEEFYRTTIGGEADHKWIDQILDDAVASVNERLRGIRFHAPAGQHTVSVTFQKRSFAESDERSRTLALEGGQSRVPAIHAMQIRGPLEVTGMSSTPSREKIFICYPETVSEEAACAERILANLAERAFRRPVNDADVRELMGFYESSRENSDFEAGVRDALSAILVSPHFIYRAEEGLVDDDVRRVNDFELASRLSFFIWSSLPDQELLDLAAENRLSEPEILAAQIGRMLADERAKALVADFAGQWLHLDRLDEINPNFGLFRYASGRLDPRPLYREELNLFIDSVLRSDQSVVRLLDADYTFVNERLAMLYGLEGVKGSRFRKVQLDESSGRFGLLGKGAILTLTANPNRTSPVLRGAWILERVLGTPPSEPPPGVETFPENRPGQQALTVRERLEMHANNPGCYGCHGMMDPLGLALENFNAIGQFRTFEADTQEAIDTMGVLPTGEAITGPKDLVDALVERTDMFVQTMTENLMTYALGRIIDYRDMPAVRQVVRRAAEEDYRFEAIVREVVFSDAFMKREAYRPSADAAERQHAAQETAVQTSN